VRLLDYTDEVCESIPSDAYELRPTDPSGGYMFSVGELIAHMADTRWACLDWINGSELEKTQGFCTEYGGTKKPWVFRAAEPCEILKSLSDARAAIDEMLSRPSDSLMASTASLEDAHRGRIERIREAGKPTADLESAGPSILANIVVFLIAHEQAHRGALQLFVREHGVNVMRFA